MKTPEEIANEIFNIYVNRKTKDTPSVVEILTKWKEDICKKQREKCMEQYDENYLLSPDIISNAIINAPEPTDEEINIQVGYIDKKGLHLSEPT